MFQADNEKIEEQLVLLKRKLMDSSNIIIKTEKEKNKIFAYLYNITRKKIIDILMSIEPSEFEETKISNDKNHLGEILYVWSPTRSFVAQNGEERNIKLYIKTSNSNEKSPVIVISFHKYGDYD